MIVFSLASGCRGDEIGGNPVPAEHLQPTVAAVPPTSLSPPANTPGLSLSPGDPAGRSAPTGANKAPPVRAAQASPTPGPANVLLPTATFEPAGPPSYLAYPPNPVPVPATDSIYDHAAVTAGRAHTCLLRTDGAVLCTGTVDDETLFPSPTVALESISSGPNHACGIEVNGSVVCWGSNDRDPWYGHTTGQADPPLGAFIAVSAGGAHTCGIRAEGSVACWGTNEYGEADPPEGAFIAVSAGGAHTCGVRPDDTLTCWGNDEFGQASPPPGEFRSVSSGLLYSCGLKADGEVVCWGFIWAGEEPVEEGGCFGLCTYSELVAEEKAGEPDPSFRQVHVGLAGSCGVTTEGIIRCWGLAYENSNPTPEGEYVGVSVGAHHACGLRADGVVVCWSVEPGEEVPGAGSLSVCLADASGATTCPGHPGFEMEAMERSGRVISWEVFSHNGTNYSCGYRLDDSLVCWNEDRSVYLDPTPASVGALAAADADTACWLLPDHTTACWVHVTTWWGETNKPEGEFQAISLGETVYSVFGCGVRTDGSLSCWGDGDPDWGHLYPPPGEYKAVSTGYGHGCAIRLDDTVACWGNHNIGTPPEGTFRSIDGSGLMHCGVRSDRSVECWGRDGSSLDLAHFLEGSYQSVAVGNFSMAYVCGVRLDGTLRCQGNHQTGEITPPAGPFRSVSAGSTHACGVRVDGTAACWATHEEAYDGDGSQLKAPAGRFRSVSVGGRWNHGSEFSCGVRTGGSLSCWGRPASAALRNLVED